MRMQEVKEIARKKGMECGKMNKCDSIRAIQKAEGNPSCYNTSISSQCGQTGCLWRADCK